MSKTKKLVLGWLGAGLLMTSLGAMAQETPTSSDVEKRLAAVEQKLSRLEERVNAALPPDAAATTNAGSDRIGNIEAKLAVIEQQKATAPATVASQVKADGDAFAVSSPDGAFKLRFGGHIQLDGRTFYDDASKPLTDLFIVRRARPILTGSLGKYIEFRLMPDFGNGTAQLFDAYGDVKFSRYLVLRGGKFKTPLGLEQLQNDADLPFLERSLATDLVPNRDEGFEIYGDIAKKVSYEFAAMNGAPDGTNIDGDGNDGKDLVGRLFATPFAKGGDGALDGLGFGIAASTGRQDGAVLPSFKTANGQNTFFTYGSSAKADGNRLRYSPQMYYYYGPVGVLAEYVVSSQLIAGKTATHRVTNHAWNTEASWMVTGEKKRYGRYVPRTGPEVSGNPLRGGFEIAARYSELNLDDAVFNYGYADSTKSARAARQWTIGTNYYIGRNTKLSLDYEQTRFVAGAATGNRPTEKTLSERLQFIF